MRGFSSLAAKRARKKNISNIPVKIESVRCLQRTSGEIPHAGGIFPAKKPHHIIGGILALGNTWTPPFGKPFEEVIRNLSEQQRVDIGISLQYGSFHVEYEPKIQIFTNDKDPLISFFSKFICKTSKNSYCTFN